MTAWVTVVAAVVTAVVGPMLVIWRQNRHQLGLLRQENTDQHAEGRQLLQTIHNDLKLVHTDLGAIDERTGTVVEAVESIREWVHGHEVHHAVEAIQRDDSPSR
jgi:cyanophycinase-like exopeptidase